MRSPLPSSWMLRTAGLQLGVAGRPAVGGCVSCDYALFRGVRIFAGVLVRVSIPTMTLPRYAVSRSVLSMIFVGTLATESGAWPWDRGGEIWD